MTNLQVVLFYYLDGQWLATTVENAVSRGVLAADRLRIGVAAAAETNNGSGCAVLPDDAADATQGDTKKPANRTCNPVVRRLVEDVAAVHGARVAGISAWNGGGDGKRR